MGMVELLYTLVLPRQFEGDVHGMATEPQHGFDVALETVAHHQQLVDANAKGGTELTVLAGRLVGHHFHTVEIVPKARTQQFVLLVENLAFGEHHHLVMAPASQGLQRGVHTLKGRGGKAQQTAAQLLDGKQGGGINAATAYLHGVLYQRQGERLAAIAQFGHVLRLRLEQLGRDMLFVAIRSEHVAVLALHGHEMRLAVP